MAARQPGRPVRHVNRWCGATDPHHSHDELQRDPADPDQFMSVICVGIFTLGFGWFQPITRYVVLRPAAGSPLVGSVYDGRWIDRPAGGVRRIVMHVLAGPAVLVPSGAYERRPDDGAVAEVWWEYPPVPHGRPGRTLLVEAGPDELPDLVEMWSR